MVENTKFKLVYRLQDPDTAKWVAEMSGIILVDDETRYVETDKSLTEVVDNKRNIRMAERQFVDTNMLLNLPSFVSYIFTTNDVPKPSLIAPIKVEKKALVTFDEVGNRPITDTQSVPVESSNDDVQESSVSDKNSLLREFNDQENGPLVDEQNDLSGELDDAQQEAASSSNDEERQSDDGHLQESNALVDEQTHLSGELDDAQQEAVSSPNDDVEASIVSDEESHSDDGHLQESNALVDEQTTPSGEFDDATQEATSSLKDDVDASAVSDEKSLLSEFDAQDGASLTHEQPHQSSEFNKSSTASPKKGRAQSSNRNKKQKPTPPQKTVAELLQENQKLLGELSDETTQ
ncbi:hypothetical protein JCM19233_3069 [Vibrio astriarenae]|nr:hypothetical protein JCM19233_3069 [Vibrio sp. C7]